MHSKSMGRALLLTALAALVPGAGAAWAQGEPQNFGEDYAPADPAWPLPLYSTHPELGGLYTISEVLFFQRTNPLKDQQVAIRGFRATAPNFPIQDTLGFTNFFDSLGPSGTFFGTGTEALNVNEVNGRGGWEPGFKAGLGWKFRDGSSVSFDYMYLTEVNVKAAATLAPPGQNVGSNAADSFLFSPVFNFPSDYGGPVNKISVFNPAFFGSPFFTQFFNFGELIEKPTVPAPGVVFGIWNGAAVETEQLLQRFDQWNVTYRTPIFETETYRISGLVGPRLSWIWEAYKWNTGDLDLNGNGSPQWQAHYSNIVSNRLYGGHVGCSNECYLGHGFAATLDLEAAMFADAVKEEAEYQLARGATGPGMKNSRKELYLVPELEGRVGLEWYPIEGVEIHAGYNAMAFFNTVASPQPIDFNYGTVNPKFEGIPVRLYDGINAGISFVF